MAERLPVGAARDIRSPSFTSFGSNISSSDVLLNALDDLPNGQMPSYKEPDLSASNTQLALNGPSTIVNRSLSQNKAGQSEATARNGSSRSRDGESRGDDEWVEQDEPGVYITLTSLPGGIKDLKRVRFSRKRFSEKQAEQWWSENRARVYQRYNVRLVDKSSIGVASDDLAQ
ncbi:PH, RCC1 and FYVE domains-containing protein 1-like protein isoform X1 [Tanacetum coccineum]|uniref:PH, RCC1 and FYVE domains-containing protein 1-like protein isoform X1 n=1 Tax=Tanacetum coccineum TaxID=301880 RepID=A0ABQ5GZM9_9ASTR